MKKNVASDFSGEFIFFGSDGFPNWEKVTDYPMDASEDQ